MNFFKKQVLNDEHLLDANIFWKSVQDAQLCLKISAVKTQEYDYFWKESKLLINAYKKSKYIKVNDNIIKDFSAVKNIPSYNYFALFKSYQIKYLDEVDKLTDYDSFEEKVKSKFNQYK